VLQVRRDSLCVTDGSHAPCRTRPSSVPRTCGSMFEEGRPRARLRGPRSAVCYLRRGHL